MKEFKTFKFKWILLIPALLLLLGITVLLIVKPWQKNASGSDTGSGKIHYYPANYDKDIMQDRVYLSYDRTLLFGTPYQQRSYDLETDREEASAEALFFIDYFSCLIEGDEKHISDYFVHGYFDDSPHFTMQMIHDMSVTLHSVDKDMVDGVETELYSYTVLYEIFQNNGTWRQGVGSNDARPQIYQLLLDDEGSYRIYRILDVVVE